MKLLHDRFCRLKALLGELTVRETRCTQLRLNTVDLADGLHPLMGSVGFLTPLRSLVKLPSGMGEAPNPRNAGFLLYQLFMRLIRVTLYVEDGP